MGESGVKRQKWGSQQRIQSNDFNGVSDLSARALIETTWAMSFGDAYRAIAAGVGGVVGGFMVQAVPGTQNVVVSPGLALIPHAQDNPATDSPMVWIQSDASETLDLSALVDPTNPRLVTIEISADLGVTFVSENRGKIDPLTGVYSTASFDIIVGGQPTYHATAGTAAASPVVATGTAGRIPLAVVKLTAAQATFADAYAPVLLCRPLVAAMGDRLAPTDYVRGGGISVGQVTGGVFVNLTTLVVGSASMNLAGLEASVGGSFNAQTEGRTIDGTTFAGLTGAVQPVYVYAANPPWADDYGDVAPREAWQRNPNEVLPSADHSIIDGEGSTFLSLLGSTGDTPGRAFRNAIVFIDSAAPWGTDNGASNGAPVRVIDARGPHPDTAPGGSGSITLDATQDPTWGASQVVSDTVYLGACSAIATANFVAQAYDGHGRIRLTDIFQIAGASDRRPGLESTIDVALTDFYPGRYPGMLVGDDEIFPSAAQHVELWIRATTGAAGAFSAKIFSKFGFGSIEGGVTTHGGWTFECDGSLTGAIEITEPTIELERDPDGACSFVLNVTAPGASLIMVPSAYTDAILASR